MLFAITAILLAACSGGGAMPSASQPVMPPGGAGAPTPISTSTPSVSASPPPTATPFNAGNVHVTEYSQPASPLYVAAGIDGSAYFGFGANGTGTNLYRFAAGALTQTAPAPAPNGYTSGGGVYGITVTRTGAVYWLSAYLGQAFTPYVEVECGGSGGTATLCEPSVDEPTSMLVDITGTFWVGGLAFNGGGQIATSSHAQGAFNAGQIMQLINGRDGAVWGVLLSTSQSQYSIAQFQVSGSNVVIARDLPLPSGDSIGSMTVGSDGAFWFVDFQRNAIGRIDAAGGAVREFPLPHAGALGQPWYGQWQIATACDGAVWFSEPGTNAIGRIDTAGTINEVPLPTAGAFPGPVAATPSAGGTCMTPAIWVGEEHANKLAAITF